MISNPEIGKDFRYMIKRHGGMLAKGRLLGLQFCALFEDGLYYHIAAGANELADTIRQTISCLGYRFLVEGNTNQIFPILPDTLLDRLKENFSFTEQVRIDDNSRAVRFCTSWATTREQVDALCTQLKLLSK